MKFYFQNYKKYIFLISVLGLLLFAFTFLYNGERETLAQEEMIWECEEEIPIGEAIDESIAMINSILSNADSMLSKGGQQVAAANRIYNIDLPGACQASNCQTDCDSYTYRCNPHPCDPDDPDGPTCWDRCRTCDISACTGNACPTDLLNEASTQVNQIVGLYPQILANAAVINQEVGKRDDIIAKLEEARTALAECATPASGYTAEEESQLLQTLFSCTEAKYQRILTEEQENCYVGAYSPNFFCCRPVPAQ